MSWRSFLSSSVSSLLRRRRADRELAEEMRHHLELEREYNMQQGLPDDEARRRAERSFGAIERYADEVRDERGSRPVDAVLQDMRFALRSLRRRFGFTTLVVLTLGFGIGATTALFAVVRSVLLTPLPYGRTEGIAVLWSAWTGFDKTWLSYDEYEAWKTEIPAFEDVGLYFPSSVNLTDGDSPERVRSSTIGANVVKILGVSPILGRTFTAEEDRPNGPVAAMISFDLWQRRYGADPSVVGRSLQLNGQAVPIVGVMPPGFKLPMDFGADGATQVYTPLATDAESEGAVPGPAFNRDGGSHGFYGIARLAPGATADVANGQLTSHVAGLVKDGSISADAHFRAFSIPVETHVTGAMRGPLYVLLGAVAMVLLIACANVAGLLLVRGERRRRELAVRVALGAGSARLTRLLFAETGLLALGGAGLGLFVAWLGIVLVRRAAPASLPRVAETQIEPGLLVFALLIGTFAALLTGILPALQATHVSPAEELKEGGKGSSIGGRLRWRQTLVTAEVALAVILVVGAGLMVRSVANLLAIDPGFSTNGVLTMRLSTPSAWYGDSVRVAAFWDGVQAKVKALPDVEQVGAVRLLPLATEMGDWGLQVEGYTPPPNTGTPGDWQVVTPGYFETVGVRLRSGRLLEARDDLNGPLAMVVNKRFTELYVSGRDPLGVRVRIGGRGPDAERYTIVGVVDDVKHNALTSDVKAQFYVTLAQFARAPGNTMRSMSLVVRTSANPNSLVSPIRRIVRETDARLPLSDVRTLDDIVGSSIAAPRFAMQLLGAFGLIALALSALGVFGVVSQVVAMREQEFGIRAALGAQPKELVRLSLATGLRQTFAGIAIGVGAALVATRLLGQLLQGVAPTDPMTFAIVVAVTAAVALLASAVPAVRAARAHPSAVLRAD